MAKALSIAAKAASPGEIDVKLVDFGSAGKNEGDVIVEVNAAGINPSDAKAMLGLMPSAVFPRTPGRDFAGVVVDGPRDLKGLEVWGSHAELCSAGQASACPHVTTACFAQLVYGT